MSRVQYVIGANTFRIIPTPLIAIQKTYTKSGDGNIIGKIYNITITGTLVAWMGSPKSDGSFHMAGGYPDDENIVANSRLSALQRKQEALRNLFSDEGHSLEIQALDATSPVKCYPRFIDINFTEGIWYDRCEYTITLEADRLFGAIEETANETFSEYISSADESWVFETDEASPEGLGKPRTYRLSHTVSATGKRYYEAPGSLEKESWEQAKDYVQSRLGFDAAIALSTGVNNLPSYYTGYNHIRSEDINKAGGSYSVTENWLIASGTVLEDFTVEKTTSLDNPYTRVSMQGTITGLEQRNASMGLTTSKYTNAQSYLTYIQSVALTRAQTYSGLTLNVLPLTEVYGYNDIGGSIAYTYEYDNRPTIITGARSVTVNVVDILAGQKYASIFVLGRTLGPVLQDLGTTDERKRSLTIEAVFSPTITSAQSQALSTLALLNSLSSIGNPLHNGAAAQTELEAIINASAPVAAGLGTTQFGGQPQENWEPLTRRFIYQKEWTYE